ncbi:MAG: hypothetical protein LBK60_05325 [Verrucomicrobiales bacterium]|jgi:hypothetical protein|nr:hypothetical protein [Verrucomicrobiales bacterium]
MNPKFFRQLRDCHNLFTPLTVPGFFLPAGVAAICVLLAVSVWHADREFAFSLGQLVAYGCWSFAIFRAALTASRLSRLIHRGGMGDLLKSEDKSRPVILLGMAWSSINALTFIPLVVVWILLRHSLSADFIGNGMFALLGLWVSCFCVALIAATLSTQKSDRGLLATLTAFFAVVIFMPALDARFHDSVCYLMLTMFIPPFDLLFCPARLLFDWPSPSAWAWSAPFAAMVLCSCYTLARKNILTVGGCILLLSLPGLFNGRLHHSTAQAPRLNLPRSPLGHVLASQLGDAAETVWHNGLTHEHREDEGHSLSPFSANTIFPRALTVSAATPDLAAAHRDSADSLHLLGVIAPLRLAFWLNPDNPLPVADAAFIAAHYANALALAVRLLHHAAGTVSDRLTVENAQFWLQVFYSGWEWRDRDLCALAYPRLVELTAADDDHCKTLAQDAADLFHHHADVHFR